MATPPELSAAPFDQDSGVLLTRLSRTSPGQHHVDRDKIRSSFACRRFEFSPNEPAQYVIAGTHLTELGNGHMMPTLDPRAGKSNRGLEG
jgi:hypothetical protein